MDMGLSFPKSETMEPSRPLSQPSPWFLAEALVGESGHTWAEEGRAWC